MLRTMGFATSLVLMAFLAGCFLSAERRAEMTAVAERPTLEAQATATVQAGIIATQEEQATEIALLAATMTAIAVLPPTERAVVEATATAEAPTDTPVPTETPTQTPTPIWKETEIAGQQATREATFASGILNGLVVGAWVRYEPFNEDWDFSYIEFHDDGTYAGRTTAPLMNDAELVQGTYEITSTGSLKDLFVTMTDERLEAGKKTLLYFLFSRGSELSPSF